MALKKCSTTDDSPHVRRLLQATQTVRRLWLENEAKSIKHIVDQYPQLKCYSLVRMVFFCLIASVGPYTILFFTHFRNIYSFSDYF